jgi:hypothetical protein
MKFEKNIAAGFVIVVLLLFQWMTPVIVYADGDTPDSPAATSLEIRAPKQTEIMTAEPRKGMPTQVHTAVQILSDHTKVVILDKNGQAVSLASEKALEIITNSDPIWCPAGQAPTPGANGCTISYLTLADLIASEGANIAADGTIWITAGIAADSNTISMDGSILSSWSNYALTLQGGWSGIIGDNGILSNSVFFAPIVIDGWNNDVTINNLNLQGTSTPSLNTSGRLLIDTTGDITINESQFTNSPENFAAVLIAENTNVTINNSSFSDNSLNGLALNAANASINNSNFNRNVFTGAGIYARNLTIRNSTFDDNGWPHDHRSIYGVGASIHPYPVGQAEIIIENSSFSNNHASGLAGAGGFFCNDENPGICETRVSITIRDSHFANNDFGITLGSVLAINHSDVIVENSVFSGNHTGAVIWTDGTIILRNNLISGNVTGIGLSARNGRILVSENLFTNNINATGISVRESGDISINDNIFSDNVTGIGLSASNGSVIISNTFIGNSTTGIHIGDCTNAALSFFDVIFSNNIVDIQGGSDCYIIIGSAPSPVPASGKSAFTPGCGAADSQVVTLSTGDQVSIFCPVSGSIRIVHLDSTALPASLPPGYSYISALSVDILQEGIPIPVIIDGGFIKASFVAPGLPEGNAYSVLYWDNGTWVPLKEYTLDENDHVQSFDLNPGSSEDRRKILSGVRLVNTGSAQRVEVSTNFPGIFVLAQH